MIQPLSDRILITDEKVEEKTASGLYIPDKAKQKTNFGIVQGIGSDVTTVQVGDKVVYDKYSGSEFEYEGQVVRLVRSDDIIAKIV